MARFLGNATDAQDLFDKLILFLTEGTTLVSLGQEWTIIEDLSVGGDWGGRHVALTPPTALDGGNLVVCLSMGSTTDPDRLGMYITTFYDYEIGTILDEQPEYSPPYFMPLWDHKMPFWFVANGRRVTGVVRVANSYECFYGGLYLPYAGDALNTFPAFCGATAGGRISWRLHNDDHSAFFDSRNYQASVWRGLTTVATESSVNNRASVATAIVDNQEIVTEWGAPSGGAVVMPYGPYSTAAYNRDHFLRKMDTLSTGESILMPMVIVHQTEGAYGEIDGLFAIAGGLPSPEMTVTIATIDYLVFPNTHRAGLADFAALRLS